MGSLARKYQQQNHTEQLQQEQKRKLLKKGKVTKGEKGIFLLYATILLGLVALMIANQARIYSTERDLFVLENEIAKQTQVNDALQLQVIELSSPDRILKIATEQLGMTLDDNKVKILQN